MEGFCEHIVKKEKTLKDSMINAAIVVASFALASVLHMVLTMYRLNIFAVLLSFASIVLGIRFVGMRKYEYEYIMTDGEMDIDLIIAQRKRKRLFTVNCRDFEIVAPFNRGNYISDYKNLKIVDCSSYRENKANYFAVIRINDERVCLVFEPTEGMLRMFRQTIPRKTFIE